MATKSRVTKRGSKRPSGLPTRQQVAVGPPDASASGRRPCRPEPGQSAAFQGVGFMPLEMRQDGNKDMLPAYADPSGYHSRAGSGDQARQQVAVGPADSGRA